MKIEDSLKTLENIAAQLENEDVDLEKGIDKYAEAIKLAKTTLTKLSKLENKITVLRKTGDALIQTEE